MTCRMLSRSIGSAAQAATVIHRRLASSAAAAAGQMPPVSLPVTDPLKWLDFTGKVVFLTGGASGIGKATAAAFARAGASVTLCDLSEAAGSAAVEAIASDPLVKSRGGSARFVRLDVSKEGDVNAAVEGTLRAHGRLDIAFNNAGIVHSTAPLGSIDSATWNRILAVNTSGVFYCMRAQIAAMKTSQHGQAAGAVRTMGMEGVPQVGAAKLRGSIINTASVAGLSTLAHMGAYVASKHAVIGLTKSAAQDHAPDGIRVNVVCPGGVATGIVGQGIVFAPEAAAQFTQNSQKRVAMPEEVAGTVLMLASHEASAYTSGAVVTVDGMHWGKF